MMLPEYQDVMSLNRFKTGELPLYILFNRISQCMPLHHHDFAEISLVVEGRGTEIINGESHPLKSGTVSVLLPHHMHEIRSEPDAPLKLYCCMFDIDVMFGSLYESSVNRWFFKISKELPSFCDLDLNRFHLVKTLLEQMALEHNESSFGRDAIMRGKLIEVLTLILRVMQQSGHEMILMETEEEQQFSQFLQFVHLHFNESITLNGMALRFKRHPSNISRMFKRMSGRYFQDYLHELRISQATSLLATTRMSLTDIALEAGFGNYRTFTRVFQQFKGSSPSAFRQSQGTKQIPHSDPAEGKD